MPENDHVTDKKKNDGNDKKKNDAGPADSATRTASMQVQNLTDYTLFSVSCTHRSGDSVETAFSPSLVSIAAGEKVNIQFETGAFADFDDWTIQFTIGDTTYQNKPNSYCNLGASDEGGVVAIRIDDDVAVYMAEVSPPSTSDCQFTLFPQVSQTAAT